MASSDPFRPNTTLQEPSLPGLPRYHVSQREVPAEYEPPARGSALGKSFGPQYQTHIVLDAQIQPKDGKKIVVITHCAPPNWHVLQGTLDRSGGGGEHQYSQQVVPTPSQATIDADFLSTYDPIDETKSMKRTKVPRRKKTDGTYESGYPVKQVKTKGQDDLTPGKYRRLVTKTETTTTETLAQANVNDIPTPADPTGDQNRITHQKLNDDQYAKTIGTEVIAEGADTLDGGRTSEWGILTTEERVVVEGSAVPHAEGVARAEVNPFGNGKAEESKVLYPTPNVSTGIIAQLLDQDQDADTKIITDIQKILVTNSKVAALATAKRADGWFVERKGQDQHHTVLIASKVDLDSLPDPEEFWDHDNISLSDRLVSLGVIWGEEKGGGSGASYNEGGGDAGGQASANATASLSASLAMEVRQGFSGKAKSKVTRTYVSSPPTALVEAYNIIPVMGTVSILSSSRSFRCSISKQINSGGTSTSISRSESVGTSGKVVQIGPFLNAGVVPTGNGIKLLPSDLYTASNASTYAYAQVTAKGTVVFSLPNSTPSVINSGDLVSRYQVVRKWRLGVWVVETVEVYAP